MKWGHDQLQNDLAAHLSAVSDRMVWTNMQLGPSGSPRPDVYTAPKSYSKFLPLAYEIKVSVSDFRSDVTTGKWQSYLKFAAGVTFAVPAGLITKADLPKGCGLIVRGDDGWKTLKAPTLQAIHDFPKSAWIKLLIDGVERAKHPLPKARLANQWNAEGAIRKKYGEDLAKALSNRDAAVYELQRQEESARTRLEAERARAERERKELRDALNKETSQVDAVRAQLCEALGLPASASIWEIKNAATNAIAALDADKTIQRMKRAADSIRHHLKFASNAIEEELPALFTNNNEETIEG